MKKTFIVEDRMEYRIDPEESPMYEKRFKTFSRAKVYAKSLPLGGWVDLAEGGKRRQVAKISAEKARIYRASN